LEQTAPDEKLQCQTPPTLI